MPQGKALDPILFLIYVNDVSDIYCYADDTGVLFVRNNWNGTRKQAGMRLYKMKIWFSENLLSINSDKSKFMYFGPRNFYSVPYNIITLHALDCNVDHDLCLMKIVNSKQILDSIIQWL